MRYRFPFENRILRIIYGSVYDNELGCWHRTRNKEIRELTGDQRDHEDVYRSDG